MRARPIAATTMALALGGIALSACSSSPPASQRSDSAERLVSSAYKAATAAKSVHVQGTDSSAGKAQRIDLVLTRNGELSGDIVVSGQKIDLVALADKDYLRATASFWQKIGGAPPSISKRIGTHWLEVPPTIANKLVSNLTVKSIFGALDSNVGKLTKTGTKTIGGERTIAVHSSKGGTLYVAASGPAYPLALVGALKNTNVNLRFSSWNSATVASAPKDSIPIESLEQ